MKEPDLSLATEAGVIHLDVSIVNPAADRHLAAQSATSPLAAAGVGETVKRVQYRHTLDTLGLREDVLVPFVVEATGRLGPAAQAFLDRLDALPGRRGQVDMASTVRFMVRSIVTCVLRGNALSMARSRNQSRVLMALP